MKRLARKFLAMLMTVAMVVSGLVVTTVTAGAKGVFDDAVKIDELEYYSKEFTQANETIYYKIALPKAGQITIRCAEALGGGWTKWCLLNANADEIDDGNLRDTFTHTIKNLEKGTYYLRIVGSPSSTKNAYVRNLYYTFTPDKKPAISLKVTVAKGSTLQLGSIVENYDGNITWVSTKKTIATVNSSGKVTAKKAGTTTIRAQLDSGEYVELKVVVKNK